jgi:proteasome accessory factor A
VNSVDLQSQLLELVRRNAEQAGMSQEEPYRWALELWERTLDAVATQQLHRVETEIDWVMKWRMLQQYAERHRLALSDDRLQQLDLAWHDIHPERGLFNIVQRRGGAARVCTPEQIREATVRPPQTTRAKLRGDFVREAQEHGRDFSVDWVHLKLNDAGQRTVLCKDPFAATDPRVDDLMRLLRGSTHSERPATAL